MKKMTCKDCSKEKTVADDEREPFLCPACMDLHRENAAFDYELEFELSQEVEA